MSAYVESWSFASSARGSTGGCALGIGAGVMRAILENADRIPQPRGVGQITGLLGTDRTFRAMPLLRARSRAPYVRLVEALCPAAALHMAAMVGVSGAIRYNLVNAIHCAAWHV